MIPSIPVKKSVSHILDVVPASKVAGVVSLENLFQPALYYLFASYTGFTSFANRDIVRSMSGITVNGKPFYTGQFELVHTREMSTNSSILTNGRMSLYKMFTNQNQKLIVMSWRGSANPADYSADVASKIGVKPDSRYYKKTVCPYTGNENRDFFVAKGFADTLTTDVLKEVVEDLNKAKSAHPGFKTVIAGHSLGAAKALLATQYLRLNHPNITIDALYTYGQPVTGSTKFNDYVARCIGPEKYVRVVSSDGMLCFFARNSIDIIPWFGTTEIKQHSSLVKEVFAPDFNQPKFVTCQGPHDTRCSAGASCKRKSWTHHSLYAGLSVSTDLASIRD